MIKARYGSLSMAISGTLEVLYFIKPHNFSGSLKHSPESSYGRHLQYIGSWNGHSPLYASAATALHLQLRLTPLYGATCFMRSQILRKSWTPRILSTSFLEFLENDIFYHPKNGHPEVSCAPWVAFLARWWPNFQERVGRSALVPGGEERENFFGKRWLRPTMADRRIWSTSKKKCHFSRRKSGDINCKCQNLPCWETMDRCGWWTINFLGLWGSKHEFWASSKHGDFTSKYGDLMGIPIIARKCWIDHQLLLGGSPWLLGTVGSGLVHPSDLHGIFVGLIHF